jgi:hypothetical protein
MLFHSLAELGAKSLWLSPDAQGALMLTADVGCTAVDQRVWLSEVEPKATLDALFRLVVQLRAARPGRLVGAK